MEVGSIGRPRQYCRRSCRQRAYEARRRAAELGFGDEELVVTRNELFDARDRLAEVADALREAVTCRADEMPLVGVLDRLIDQLDGIVGRNDSH